MKSHIPACEQDRDVNKKINARGGGGGRKLYDPDVKMCRLNRRLHSFPFTYLALIYIYIYCM